MSSESREQANKQTNKRYIAFSTPNSPGQKRGEEMRGEEKEFVIDHKKTKKKKREKKNQERRIPELQANKRCLMSDTDESSE